MMSFRLLGCDAFVVHSRERKVALQITGNGDKQLDAGVGNEYRKPLHRDIAVYPLFSTPARNASGLLCVRPSSGLRTSLLCVVRLSQATTER